MSDPEKTTLNFSTRTLNENPSKVNTELTDLDFPLLFSGNELVLYKSDVKICSDITYTTVTVNDILLSNMVYASASKTC